MRYAFLYKFHETMRNDLFKSSCAVYLKMLTQSLLRAGQIQPLRRYLHESL